jgi:DNA-directed RNA polymerase subunit RPC12/RpoP
VERSTIFIKGRNKKMHEGCTGNFDNGKAVVDKIRMMGFNTRPMPMSVILKCVECGNEFEMTHLETKCPHCGMVYGVTPCSTAFPDRIKAAGIDY